MFLFASKSLLLSRLPVRWANFKLLHCSHLKNIRFHWCHYFFTLALPWRTEDEHNLQGVPNHTRVECTLFFLKKGGIKVPQRPAIRHFMKILKWILGAANLLLRHLLRHLFALLFAHFYFLLHLLWYFSSTLKLPQKKLQKTSNAWKIAFFRLFWLGIQ